VRQEKMAESLLEVLDTRETSISDLRSPQDDRAL
jgi:hypothetical protein